MSPRIVPLLSLLALVAAPAFAEDTPPATPPPPAADAPAAAPAAPADLATPDKSAQDDLSKQLADTQEKLATALHSYSLLQDENTQLKSDTDKAASDKAALTSQLDDANRAIEALKQQAAVATQVDGLRDQLRQFQNEVAALATENAGLRTRLALSSNPPGIPSAQAPIRPVDVATAAPMDSLNPIPPAAPSKADSSSRGGLTPPAAAPADAPARTYTVVAGDSLTKISKKMYGTTSKWGDILAANRDVIKNANNVPLGAKLKIP